MVAVVDLEQLRRDAGKLVRRAASGETITILADGQPAAQLVPLGRVAWHRFEEVEGLFSGPSDATWEVDLNRLDHTPQDPFDYPPCGDPAEQRLDRPTVRS